MKRLGKYFLLLVLFMSVFSVMVYALNAKPEQRPDIIKIGAIGPLEITPGQDMEKGAMLAVEEINAGDGVTVGGTVHDIELIVETTFDTTLGIPDPTQGSISLTKLLDSDNVAAVVGGFRTEVVMAL
ncbi:MAG: hypothetical protein ACXACP_13105, partial [Candidatus Hodarchaeales archaeon]